LLVSWDTILEHTQNTRLHKEEAPISVFDDVGASSIAVAEGFEIFPKWYGHAEVAESCGF